MRGWIKEEWLPCFSGQGQCSGLFSHALYNTHSAAGVQALAKNISLSFNLMKRSYLICKEQVPSLMIWERDEDEKDGSNSP